MIFIKSLYLLEIHSETFKMEQDDVLDLFK